MQIALLLAQLFPLILAAVRGVEAAIPQAGQGLAKHRAVFEAVSGLAIDAPTALAAGVQAGESAKVGDVPGMSSAISQVIQASVKMFNEVGAFQKSGAVQAITAAQNAAENASR